MPGSRRLHLTRLSTLALVLAALSLLPVAPAAAGSRVTRSCDSAPAGFARCDLSILVKRSDADAIAATGPAVGDPGFLQQAYDLTALSARRGHGDTVAIVDAFKDPTVNSDLATYRSHYGLSACSTANGCLKIVNQHGQSSPLPAANPAWAVEITADLDAVSAICPNCRIDLVESTSDSGASLETAMRAAAQLGADQISDSWSIVSATSPFGSSIATMLGSANTPAVIAATGDTGAVPSGDNAYPAALSDVTAVGGTTLASSASARGITESAWSGTSYGCDTAESALAYQSTKSCTGRAYADISADADPHTGLAVYSSTEGGWIMAGGTSLATPIVAAYEALTGVNGQSNRWAYSDVGALNSLSGGYSGQTGTGTISGDIVTGAPGIATAAATSATATSVTLAGGIYTNGSRTNYAWQYGTVGTYGAHTTTTVLNAAEGATQVSTVISGLAPSTTYHFRLLAHNANGREAGYDATVTTGER